MKNFFLSLAIMLAATPCFQLKAQETSEPTKLNIALDTRADFSTSHADDADETEAGFHGRYMFLMVNGSMAPKLTYNWRQRLNKMQDCANDVFAATDWVYLTYAIDRNWSISGGKQEVMIGGYEYDAYPIDVFFASRFWNNIECFQFGAGATYTTNDANHWIMFQVTNSPYTATNASCFAYNLFWSGSMGPFSTLWSVNMMEYERNRYVNYISLGNRLTLGDFDLQVDLQNRYTAHHKFIKGDYTVVGKASYNIKPWLTVFAKGGYDEYKVHPNASESVDNPFYGGGFEFYPLPNRRRDLRLHAVVDRVSDNAGIRYTQVNLGFHWRINFR